MANYRTLIFMDPPVYAWLASSLRAGTREKALSGTELQSSANPSIVMLPGTYAACKLAPRLRRHGGPVEPVSPWPCTTNGCHHGARTHTSSAMIWCSAIARVSRAKMLSRARTAFKSAQQHGRRRQGREGKV